MMAVEDRKVGWQLNPAQTENWECEIYVDDSGLMIATVETFHYGVYPHALDTSGVWRRGGCFVDLAAAKSWAEQIAGLRPKKAETRCGPPSSPIR